MSLENLSLALEFPRTWLKPVDPDTNQPYEDENRKAMLRFDAGAVRFSTEEGLAFENESSFSFDKSMIGNTGMTLEFTKVKLDLSRTTNIPEAAAAGYPEDFVGVFVKEAAIGLPEQWFKDTDGMSLVGRNLLIGTGGFSGTVGLKSTGTTWANLGDNGFRVGFNSFDLTFRQNAIVESNIRAKLVIPRFKDNATNEDLEIDVIGHLSENGDFNLTAALSPPLHANLFNFVNFDFKNFEIGRQEGNFYLGTSCDIWFPEDSVMHKIIEGQKITIPNLRIYSDGTFELVGGTACIPTNISLRLGPVNVGVTGINFGSYQRKMDAGNTGVEEMRQYNYFGFDGAISINPLGIDARGEGIKYYYTVDNDPANGEGKDSFLHIQTIEADLVIPGNVPADQAAVIIHGMLSIPEPGASPEYRGEISLKIPKAKIAAGAGMRLAPRYPAFLVDAFVDLPAPIPIGPVGIYGFRTLLGLRYVAEKEAVGLVSGKNTWYDYFTYPPRGIHIDKFSGPEKTKGYNFPFSLGAGAVLGTSFDGGKIISVRAMMVLSLPSMFMIEGKASLLGGLLGLDDTKEPPFFAFLAFGDNSIELGMGADLKFTQEKGDIIALQAQVQALFPFKNSSGWYIHAGTKEKPIMASVFPEHVDLRAYSYLELSSKGISTGAGVNFELKKKFFGIGIKLYAFAEVGGMFSFEKPRRLGGFLHFGGGIDVNVWKVLYAGFDIDAYLSVEAPKPFLIYARLVFAGKIKLLCINIKFNVKLELKWESNTERIHTHVEPMDSVQESVKGVHILTNDTFALNRFDSVPSADSITAIIPLDTYIDIRAVKDLNIKNDGASGNVLSKLVNLTPVNATPELISPISSSHGKCIHQTVHSYTIERLQIKAWKNGNGSGWTDYHPYSALVKRDDRNQEVANGLKIKDLPVGSWQIYGKQHDNIRLLASNPFSYMDGGEPGWTVPEQDGVSAESIFCPPAAPVMKIMNVLNKPVGKRYFHNPASKHAINGLYFAFTKSYEGDTLPEDRISPNVLEVIQDFQMLLDENGHPHMIDRSLSFSNFNTLEINFPKDAAHVKLKLVSCAEMVEIRFYTAVSDSQHKYMRQELIDSMWVHRNDLYNFIVFDSSTLISKIEIEPLSPDMTKINTLKKQIEKLKDDAYEQGIYHNNETAMLEQELDRLIHENCCMMSSYYYYYNSGLQCKTSLQELRWLTMEEAQRISTVSFSPHYQRTNQQALEASTKQVQPVWRPDTCYYIHFKLKDFICNEERSKYYDYYFGFKTPPATIGHYTGDLEKYNRLDQYIDYKRSYPNADGNLLQSKPSFYKAGECVINLFFTHPHAAHLLKEWPEYDGLSAIANAVNIKIKDPVSEELVTYPYTLPNFKAMEKWDPDNNPRVFAGTQAVNNLIAHTPCDSHIAPLSLQGLSYKVTLGDMKPQKLYTALVFNAYAPSSVNPDDQNREIHKFVFQTSRYGNFTEQVESYILKDEENPDENKAAVFPLWVEMTNNEIADAYALVSGVSSDALLQYPHPFDKVVEGIFRCKPLEAAVTTEFNIIRNGDAVIGILVRNPEPFNDPKMPPAEMAKTITVNNGGFKTLHSKDYAQALIMKTGNNHIITEPKLILLFKYKLWDGNEYTVKETVPVHIVIE